MWSFFFIFFFTYPDPETAGFGAINTKKTAPNLKVKFSVFTNNGIEFCSIGGFVELVLTQWHVREGGRGGGGGVGWIR